MKHLFSTLALIIALASSAIACVGEFTYTITDNVVAFHGTSDTPGVTYHWNFGDQSDANGENVTHTYTLYPEHYTVCLTITNSSGCSDEYCAVVYVQTGPADCEGSFTYTINNNTVSFAGSSTYANVDYHWIFNDGSDANGQNLYHVYDQFPEHYNVCLVIHNTGVGCIDTVCQTVFVEHGPATCEASFTTESVDVGEEAHFTDASAASSGTIVSWSWEFGDGTPANLNQNPGHVYSSPGTYEVCLTATSSTGCTDTYCHPFIVTTACEASFTYTVNGNTVAFTGSSTTSSVDYIWDFGDNHDGVGQNVTHTFTQYPEHYDVCLIIRNSNIGCHDTICQNIYVPGPSCEAFYQFTNTNNVFTFHNYSQGSNLSYEWSYGDGTSATGQNPGPHTYAISGTYPVCLTVFNTSGCQDTYCREMVVTVPTSCQASFTYAVSGNSVAFSGSSSNPNVDYHWIFGDGSDANGQNPTHTFTQSPEHYNVCLVIHNTAIGCIDTVCQNIFIEGVNNECEASFTYAVNGNHVTFTGASSEPGVHYYWIFGDGSIGDDQTNTHTYTAYPEHYNACLVISNSNTGCSDTVCQNIYVQSGTSECEASFTATITGTEVHFHGQSTVPGVHYHWTFGDGTEADGENPVHNYTQAPEHYQVCLTISNDNGCEDQFCETIYIQSTTNTACDASFTYTISGTEVHFHGSSNVPGVYYNWSFGDGTTGSGENPGHNYTQAPEHYQVCLTIYNGNGCQNTQCETIFIEGEEDDSDCHGSFTYTLEGNQLAVHGSSSVPGVYYHWSFGDGETASGENATHSYTAFPEHYQVCLTIYNSNGCQNTTCQTIYVQSSGGGGEECEASFTYEINNNSVHFFGESNQDNVDYSWIFGDNSTGTGQDPHHTYTQFPEHYNVCLIIHNSNTGCADTVCQTIYVQHGAPSACSAEFTYTITGNEVHFNGPSNADGTHYQWSFGDGHSSDMHNPNHVYTLFPEHYEVCLTVTNSSNSCSETVCHTIFIEHDNNLDHVELSGTIYAGQDYADQGYVMLIQYDAGTGMLTAVQTVGIGANGHYVFPFVLPGNYFLKAALSPTSNFYASYLPTYFEHELFWYNADVISLTSSMNRSIHLIGGNNPGGPGFIGGLVTQGANKTTGPGDPVADVQVMLLSMDDEPLQYTFSDANGEFSFSNVAYGTYKVYGEVYNLTTNPAIVTVTAGVPSIADIGLIITDKEVTTGVYEPAVINESAVGEVFPNPFKGDASIYVSLAKDARLSIQLFDIAGRQVYADIANFGAGVQQINLPVSALNSGIYSLVLSDEKSNTMVARKLVKTE